MSHQKLLILNLIRKIFPFIIFSGQNDEKSNIMTATHMIPRSLWNAQKMFSLSWKSIYLSKIQVLP